MKYLKLLGMARRSSLMLLTIILLLSTQFSWAQNPDNGANKRPKIALVLGGGGARGAAHVGVLKILEANHVPIDFIVGTSMGSIVGGLYAAGYSPDEMEKLFKDIDWNDMLTDRPSEDQLSFRDKMDLQNLANLEIGISKGKLSFPQGLISGQKLGFLLNKMTIHTVTLQSFDQLRIPFRAVTTDAVTGDMVLFDKGNLAQAIRASMSVPGAFPPVKVNGRLLMDGFIVANVPVEIAKQWGADIIIAVDVGSVLLKEEDLKNLVSMTAQMFNILSLQNVERSEALLTEKDLLIKPDLTSITSADFMKTPEAVKRGEKAALEHLQDIKRYSVSEDEFKGFLANQRVRDRNPIMIDFVDVVKPARVNEKMVEGRIKTKAGKPLNFDQLQTDLNNVYAIGDFETVGFNIEEKNGKKGLVVKTNEKSWGPEYLRFGLNMQGEVGGPSNYTFILDYRHTQFNTLGAELNVSGKLGQTSGIYTDFFQPLDVNNRFFVDPMLQYDSYLRDIYDSNGDQIAQYRRTEYGGGIDFGVNIGSSLEVRLGLRRSVLKAEPEIGGELLPSFDNVQKGGVLAQFNYDNLDDHRFPTRGSKVQARLFLSETDLGADESYQKVDFILGAATTVGVRHTLFALLQGGMSLETNLPFYEQFTTGGFLKLSGLAEGQLRGNNKGVASLVYMYRLVDTKGLASKVYLGVSLEAGNVWADRDDFGQDPIYGGSGFLGLDTILGPMYFGYGFAEGNSGRAFGYLGKTF
jgi:NTE family protein